MSPTQPLPPKKEVALALLERSTLDVHLDPRQTPVVVPPWFKKQAQLVLKVGLNMPVPIPDLRVDDQGMTCTLSFNRSPFYCVVPWSAVFAMVGEDGRGMVWPDDVPTEVARQAHGRAAEAAVRKDESKPAAAPDAKGEGSRPKRPRKRRALAAVSDAAAAPDQASGEPTPATEAVPSAAAGPLAVPAPPSRPSEGTARRRRELPPYLRVVK